MRGLTDRHRNDRFWPTADLVRCRPIQPWWDGIRCIGHVGEVVCLQTRRLNVVTRQFPEVAEALRQLPTGIVVDGELVVFEGGRPSFEADSAPEKNGKRATTVKKGFKSACRKAGIEDFTSHDLRHTCAAWLAQARVPLAEIRDLLRHTSVQVTEKYAHLGQDNVRQAVAVLDASHDQVTPEKEKAITAMAEAR